MVVAHWRSTAAHLSCRAVFTPNVSSSRKDNWTGPNFFMLLPFLAGTALQPWWVGWQPATTFPIRRTSAGCASAARLAAAAPKQITADRCHDLIISFSSGLWKPHGLSQAVARQPSGLTGGEWLARTSSIYLQSRTDALPTLVRVVVTDAHQFVMGAQSRHARRRRLVCRTALPPFPTTTPNGFSRSDSRFRHSPAETTSPKLDPQPAAHPLDRSLFSVREANPGQSALEVFFRA